MGLTNKEFQLVKEWQDKQRAEYEESLRLANAIYRPLIFLAIALPIIMILFALLPILRLLYNPC